MTLPDVRRLLQVILAPEDPEFPDEHAIQVSDWRQERNQIARECHTRTREERLRNTG
jgi:hypothetical protein